MYKYELKRKRENRVLDTKWLPEIQEEDPWYQEIKEGKWIGRGLYPHNYEVFITRSLEEQPKSETKKKKPSTKKIKDAKNLASLKKALIDYLEELDA